MLSYFIKTVSKTYYKALNLKDPFMYFREPCTQKETNSETRDPQSVSENAGIWSDEEFKFKLIWGFLACCSGLETHQVLDASKLASFFLNTTCIFYKVL